MHEPRTLMSCSARRFHMYRRHSFAYLFPGFWNYVPCRISQYRRPLYSVILPAANQLNFTTNIQDIMRLVTISSPSHSNSHHPMSRCHTIISGPVGGLVCIPSTPRAPNVRKYPKNGPFVLFHICRTATGTMGCLHLNPAALKVSSHPLLFLFWWWIVLF